MKTAIKNFINRLLWSDRPLARILPPVLLSFLDRLATPPAGNSYHGSRAIVYDSVRLEQDWWHEEHRGLEKILQSLAPFQNVLDVPSGTGRFFSIYSSLDSKVSGLDSSSEMTEKARLKASELGIEAHLEVGDARRMPFEDSSFDIVVSFRFLQSIVSLSDAVDVIREIARVSRQYAVLELDVRVGNQERRFEPSKKAAMRNKLSLEEITSLLSGSNLRVLRVEGPFKKASQSQYAFVCEKTA